MLKGKLINSPQIVSVDATAGDTALTITSSVVLLSVVTVSSSDDITYTVASGTDGQMVNIFYTGKDGTNTTNNVTLDFGADSLFSGTVVIDT